MARKRRRSSHRRKSHRRRRSSSRGLALMNRRRRSNPARMNRHHRRHHRRNPSFGGWGTRDLLWAGGGGVVNGIACRAIPNAIPQLAAYNVGWTGYAINAAVGAVGAWGIGKFNRQAGMGAWIGMIVAVAQRIIADNFGSGIAGQTAGMAGDPEMSLGYYSEPYPNPQGASAGPYSLLPGSPYSFGAPTANAAAPARAAAAQAAAPALVAASANGPQPGAWQPPW